MEKVSNAPPTTRSSPNPDGVRQAPWQWERVYSAVKTCPVCGKDFHPNIWFDQNRSDAKWKRTGSSENIVPASASQWHAVSRGKTGIRQISP